MPDEIRTIDCRSAVRQLWDYLDGELDDARMRDMHHHLQVCEQCLPHADFGHRFLDALHRARERHAVPAAVRTHVMAALTDAGFVAD